MKEWQSNAPKEDYEEGLEEAEIPEEDVKGESVIDAIPQVPGHSMKF